MRHFSSRSLRPWKVALGLLLCGCQGEISGHSEAPGAPGGRTSAPGSSRTSPAPGAPVVGGANPAAPPGTPGTPGAPGAPAAPLAPAAPAPPCDPGGETLRGARIWRLTQRQLQRSLDEAVVEVSQGRLKQMDQAIALDDGGKDSFQRTAATLQLGGTSAEQLITTALAFAETNALTLTNGLACLKAPAIAADCAQQVATALLGALGRGQVPDDVVTDHRDLLVRTAAAQGKDEGIKIAVAAALVSPYTMFRWEQGRTQAQHRGKPVRALDHVELASALSYTLANRPPPRAFVAELAQTDLSDAVKVEALARKHLVGAGAAEAVRDFVKEMLRVGPINPLAANDPLFTQAVADRLVADTGLWLDDLVGRSAITLKGLLSTDAVVASPDSAFVYGLARTAAASPGSRVTAPAGQRVGILSQPAFLSSHAFAGVGDPVHRGKVIRDNLFCAALPPPPPEAANVMVPTDPKLSNRQRFAEHGRTPACVVCHKLMDEMGFALEKYDGAGRFKNEYANRTPIDDSGFIHGTDVDGPVRGAAGLGEALLRSSQVKLCVSGHLFRYAVGDAANAGDACTVGGLQARFGADTDFVRALVEIVLSPSFRFRK